MLHVFFQKYSYIYIYEDVNDWAMSTTKSKRKKRLKKKVMFDSTKPPPWPNSHLILLSHSRGEWGIKLLNPDYNILL